MKQIQEVEAFQDFQQLRLQQLSEILFNSSVGNPIM